MLRTRRGFLQSLSRTGVVLSFEQILATICPSALLGQSSPAQKEVQGKLESPLGVAFVDIARQAGFKTKTIFGGEKKNKYLLETTGCGIAFYDYDNDGWLDIFVVMDGGLKVFLRASRQPVIYIRTIEMAPLLM